MRVFTMITVVALSGVACSGDDDDDSNEFATGGTSTGGSATSGGAGAVGGQATGTGGVVEGPVVEGCPTYPEPVARPGDDPGSDTWEASVQNLLATYCTGCHSSTLTDPESRNYAPAGYDWDDEAAVRAHLADIRLAVGEENFMPPGDPAPTCEERFRLVRWIDLGAP